MLDIPAGRRVLVTGASGFIGHHLVSRLGDGGVPLTLLSRAPIRNPHLPRARVQNHVGDLTRPETLASLCNSVDTIFHLAGYAHAREQGEEQARLHENVTVAGTRNLLDLAVQAGVRRVVFVSTVKAINEGTVECADEQTPAAPQTPYGRAKLAAERMVLSLAAERRLRAAVLRLPLVYGPGSKGNLMRMIAAIARRRFLPPPRIPNKRSMVHVHDVVEAALLVAQHEKAAGQVYIVTDQQVYSTREIYERACLALGMEVPRWSVPEALLRASAKAGDVFNRLTGSDLLFDSQTWQKMFGSAWYSCAKISEELGFRPTQTLWQALPEMVVEYQDAK